MVEKHEESHGGRGGRMEEKPYSVQCHSEASSSTNHRPQNAPPITNFLLGHYRGSALSTDLDEISPEAARAKESSLRTVLK